MHQVELLGDLVIGQDGRILGHLVPWGIPGTLAKRCPKCGDLVPERDWEYHQDACRRIGWGHYRCPIAGFTPSARKQRVKVDFAAELAKFLK